MKSSNTKVIGLSIIFVLAVILSATFLTKYLVQKALAPKSGLTTPYKDLSPEAKEQILDSMSAKQSERSNINSGVPQDVLNSASVKN